MISRMETGGHINLDLFRQIFRAYPAQVALLDNTGQILAVNPAWIRFGRSNGIRNGYRVVGLSYLDVCARAAGQGDSYARDAMAGIVGVLQGIHPRFTLNYPCHSPTQNRWFKMYAEAQSPQSPSIIVAHLYLGPSVSKDPDHPHLNLAQPPSEFPVWPE